MLPSHGPEQAIDLAGIGGQHRKGARRINAQHVLTQLDAQQRLTALVAIPVAMLGQAGLAVVRLLASMVDAGDNGTALASFTHGLS